MELPDSIRWQDTQPEGEDDELLRLLTELGQPYEPKLDYLTPERKRLR